MHHWQDKIKENAPTPAEEKELKCTPIEKAEQKCTPLQKENNEDMHL